MPISGFLSNGGSVLGQLQVSNSASKQYEELTGKKQVSGTHMRYDVFINNVFSMEDDHDYDQDHWNYYSKDLDGEITKEEFKSAVINLFYNYVLKYTNEKAHGGKKWTLYGNAPVTQNVSKGAAKAFAEFIVNNWS